MTHLPLKKVGAALLAIGLLLSGCSGDIEGRSPVATEGCKPAHANIDTVNEGMLTVWVYVSPPSTIQTGNDFSGVDADLVKEIAARECLEADFKAVAGAALIAGIQAGRADIGIGGIYYTEDRAAEVGLSAPVYQDGVALIGGSDISGDLTQLDGKKIGVIQGTLWTEDFQEVFGDDVTVYQATDGLLTDLNNGRIDAGVLNSAEAAIRAESNDGLTVAQVQSFQRIEATLGRSDVVLAMPPDAESLKAAVDEDIAELISSGSVADTLTAYGMDPALAAGK